MDGFSDTGSIPVASTKKITRPNGSGYFFIDGSDGPAEAVHLLRSRRYRTKPCGLCSTGDFCERINSQKSQFPSPDAKHCRGAGLRPRAFHAQHEI